LNSRWLSREKLAEAAMRYDTQGIEDRGGDD